MIAIRFDHGQGLGNQLWCYVTARVIALDNEYDLGFYNAEAFKGSDFLSFDLSNHARDTRKTYIEKQSFHPRNGSDIRLYDSDLPKVADGTLIEGLLQGADYIAHRRDEIRSWFQLHPEDDCRDYSNESICIINFRGTGYVNEKELFLPLSYWRNAMQNMRKINPEFSFIVVTEDVTNARRFFPDLEVYHWSIGKDFAVVKNAKYLILSNSSFAWFPAWISTDLQYCIAPKYWARHNVSDGYWCLGTNLTKEWVYQDRTGALYDYETCKREHDAFIAKHANYYSNHTYHSSPFKWIREEACRFNILQRELGIWNALRNLLLTICARALNRVKAWLSNVLRHPAKSIYLAPQKLETIDAREALSSCLRHTQRSTIHRLVELLKDFLVKQGYY